MAAREPAGAQGDGAFPRPRCLLCLTEQADEELAAGVGKWLQAAGLAVDALGAAEGGRPFLVVSASRDQLEASAEAFGYLKAHASLPPHVKGQGLGKLEFRRGDEAWLLGYEGYEAGDFWLPCERAQLLHTLLDAVPAPEGGGGLAPHLKRLRLAHREAGLAGAPGGLLAALRGAGLLAVAVPLHEGREERLAPWAEGLLRPLAPAAAVQRYFGSHVALYFAWMNSFTRWLALPAVLGLACSAHMRLAGLTVDDHPYLPFYSLCAVLWGAAFARSWERVCAAHAWRWNVYGVKKKEQVRPEFRGELRVSPVTGGLERHSPSWKRYKAYGFSALVTGAMLCVAFFVMICSLNLQGYMEEHVTTLERFFYIQPLAHLALPGALFDPDQTEYFGLLAYVPVLLHVVVIMQLNKHYRHVSEWLTENENHRLEEEHENSLIAKRFVFEAFDCYVALFYVGFVQQDLRKLRSELTQLYTMDSLRRAVCETVLPFVAKVAGRRRSRERYAELKKADRADHAEALDQLDQAEYEQFDDFLEMVIEFGYVTLFASAFPLAGLLSLASNLVEIKSDLFKLTRVYQRPVAARSATLGTWGSVLYALVFLSIPTNVMLFAMSEQMASWLPFFYREATEKDVLRGVVVDVVDDVTGNRDLVMRRGSAKYVVFIAVVVEHIVGLLVLLLVWAIPKEPEWVSEEVARMELHREEQARAQREAAWAPAPAEVGNEAGEAAQRRATAS